MIVCVYLFRDISRKSFHRSQFGALGLAPLDEDDDAHFDEECYDSTATAAAATAAAATAAAATATNSSEDSLRKSWVKNDAAASSSSSSVLLKKQTTRINEKKIQDQEQKSLQNMKRGPRRGKEDVYYSHSFG